MQLPKAAIFDLDNTLADPYRDPSDRMSQLLQQLIAVVPVSIMSAASLERMERTVLKRLSPAYYDRLTLFTANAAQAFVLDGTQWRNLYRFDFTPEEREHIEAVLEATARELGQLDAETHYGERFVDYEGYVAFTALGTDAPASERAAWDPDQKKRRAMKAVLDERLPEYDVLIGGSTTIDITKKGINKRYGIEWFANYLKCTPQDLFYVGDALYEGGNDAVVIPTGIQTRQVSGPSETETVIEELLAKFAN